MINAGDPADGAGTAIGAIGPDDTNPVDLFGRVLPLTGAGPDVTPPTGSVAINNGATVTATTTVTLTLSAFDGSGVAQMRFSNDNITFTALEAYATTKTWTLTPGDGLKTVFVQYQDSVGNRSPSFTASITLDTTGPIIATPTASNVTGSSATIGWTTNEPSTSTVDYGVTTAYGQTTSNLALVTTHSASLTGLSPSTLYHYRVRSTDAAGNASTSGDATFTTTTTQAPPPPPGGLVAAYGFEDASTSTTTADASGHNLTGTIQNAEFVTGRFGTALNFHGTNGQSPDASFVTIAPDAALDLTTGMTISAWVKPSTSLPQWPTVVMKQRDSELTYALYANSNTGQPNINYTSDGSEVNLNAGSGLPVGEWTYLAGTFDGTTMKLYVNGNLVGTLATSAPIDVTGGVLRIGADDVWQDESFPGVIDEVRIYNRALSQAEIQNDMANPVVAGSTPHP